MSCSGDILAHDDEEGRKHCKQNHNPKAGNEGRPYPRIEKSHERTLLQYFERIPHFTATKYWLRSRYLIAIMCCDELLGIATLATAHVANLLNLVVGAFTCNKKHVSCSLNYESPLCNPVILPYTIPV